MARPEAEERAVAQRLDLLSRASLKKVAQTLGVSSDTDDPASWAAALSSVIGTPDHFRALERNLSETDWSLLDLLPAQIGPFQVRTLAVAPLAQGPLNADPLWAVSRLLACAAALPVQTGQRGAKMNIERDQIRNWSLNAWLGLAPGVAGWARERQSVRIELTPVEPPATVADSTLPELRRVAFLLLSEADRRPIRLTAEGTPHKADLRRIALSLSSSEPRTRGRQSIAEAAPAVLYLALAALSGAGLLHVRNSSLQPGAAAADFFTAPAERQVATLFLGWRESQFDDFLRIPTLWLPNAGDGTPWLKTQREYLEPTSAQLVTARVAIGEAIARLDNGNPSSWHRIDELAEFIFAQFPEILFSRSDPYSVLYNATAFRPGSAVPQQRLYPGVYGRVDTGTSAEGGTRRPRPLRMDADWMLVEGAFVRQVLAESMRFLGLVQVGPTTDAPDRFHLTDLGRHILLGRPLTQVHPTDGRSAAIIQPNFEIVVVDAAANFALLAQLDVFADRQSFDRAATYRLTQDALVRGLDRGWTGARILEALVAANGGQLPQNVAFSLEQWIRLYEGLSLREDATVLELDAAEQLDRILENPQLRTLLGARLGPTTALVPSRHVERLVRAAQVNGNLDWVDYSVREMGAISVHEPDRIELRAAAAEPYLRYRLRGLATLIEDRGATISTVEEQKWLYRITPEAVAAAVEAGWNGRQLAGFLSAAAGEPLPDDFLVRLLGWSGSVPVIGTETLVALKLQTGAADWAMLRKITAVGQLIRATPSATLALVAPDDLDALCAELELRGLVVRRTALPEADLLPEVPETGLRPVLAQYRRDPDAIRTALKSLGLLGKIQTPPGGWY